jgi:SNF2 family DNA or RNA helicase
MAQAICQLDCVSRWVVTGTPIQNHLSDLAALLKFLRVYPYDEPKRFEADISRYWKSGEDKEAVKRLKRLASCIILRRAKNTIDLPPRRDMKCPVDFSVAERDLYNAMRQQTITRIDEILMQDSEVSTSGVFVNFLQQIESMRLVCNLGLHYMTRHEKPLMEQSCLWDSEAQQTFNIQREMETMMCSQCSTVLDLDQAFLDDSILDSPQFSRCLKYVCAECSYKLRLVGQKMVCGHTPRCPIAPVSVNESAFEETPNHVSRATKSVSIALPSKVQVLIADLKNLPHDVKR